MTIRAFNPSCPVPLPAGGTITLAHGGGGRLSHDLISRLILPAFGAEDNRHDSAVLDIGAGRVAFTTDSYVVKPRFFPGGDIGKLAVYGTVNDLAMAGATPTHLSVGLILEEGLAIDELQRVVSSMADAARECGVRLVTGDTKVVDHGKGDGLFVNTSGLGIVPPGVTIAPAHVRPGDSIIVSGDIGRHGIAVLSVREGLAFESPIESDCASLYPLVYALLDAGVLVHCLRDATRGGLATVLNEIAREAQVAVSVDEARIPVCEPVAGACELLGLDPLYVACEGRMVVFTAPESTELAVEILRARGHDARHIGHVMAGRAGQVSLRTRVGVSRLLDMLSGEQLPRIC